VPKLDTQLTALGSPCEFQLYGQSMDQLEEVTALCRAELSRIERKYSRYLDGSIVSEINRCAGSGNFVALDSETARLLDYAKTVFDQSDGLFDITSGVLRQAWNFKSNQLPTDDALRELCKRVGWKRVEFQGASLHLPVAGMEIDFGGFGKEYAADRVAGLCRGAGITAGLIDLGGDVCILGAHPDGSAWQVGIRNPRDPERAMAVLPLSRGALATSGDYERFMEIDGERYCHLLDPRTGWPIRGLAGVSVVAEQCLVAGTATTVAMLKGTQGPRWLKKLGLPYLWVDAERKTGGSLWPKNAPNPGA
jgi:thiamine biosynthesis lipoprotein